MDDNNVRAIRGMGDIMPSESPYWREVEDAARVLFGAYGYGEIRLPLLEKTALFSRAIGEATDIVEKEMYTFTDRGGESLTLRPEGTAGCVRAGIEHGLIRNQRQRLWYVGPMFRHERPQKGRYRQFHQIGVEAFGFSGSSIEAEMLLMSARLWRRLGLSGLRLELNCLDTGEAREAYRQALVGYFSKRRHELDEDSLRRLDRNPLRILDSKRPDMQPIIRDAPSMPDFLGAETKARFQGLLATLDALKLDYTLNPRLVRGLDYYTGVVFEWVTDKLGAQGAVCAGGRYDGLVAGTGGPDAPAVGFALGLERLIALIKEDEGVEKPIDAPHAYLATGGDATVIPAQVLAETLRERFPSLRLLLDPEPRSFKAKLKGADRSGATVALILGDAEYEQGVVGVKHLRESIPQQTLPPTELDELIGTLLTCRRNKKFQKNRRL